MAFEPKENSCFAFARKPDANPKAPDFKGTILISTPGVYDLAMWKGEVGNGKYKGMSVKLSVPFNKSAPISISTPPPTSPSGEPLPY